MSPTQLSKQVSEMVFQALSHESINLAEPMNDMEIKVLAATIERLVNEGFLQNASDLVTEPQRLIELLKTGNNDEATEQHARKTLRRFREVIINLSSEPEIRVLN